MYYKRQPIMAALYNLVCYFLLSSRLVLMANPECQCHALSQRNIHSVLDGAIAEASGRTDFPVFAVGHGLFQALLVAMADAAFEQTLLKQ